MSIYKSISGDRAVACGAVQYYQQQCEQRVREAAPRLRRALLAAGVTRLTAEYDGVGDSGQFESVTFQDAKGEELTERTELKHLEGEVTNLFYDLLETRHGGWENNEGGYGTFVWNLVTDYLQHEHSQRFEDVDTSTHEGFEIRDTDAGEAS